MQKITNFVMSHTLITKEQWDAISLWALAHGYSDLPEGKNLGKQPVGNITWFDALKFCNAASELAGLQPVYRLADGSVYRTGRCEHPILYSGAQTGYRLPTSEEWEIACRAGTDTLYYWGDSIDPDYAWFSVGDSENLTTRPVGLLKPNAYGLFDMSGNAYEWCFDTIRDHLRVLRGGSVALDSVITSSFVTFTGPDYFCFETSLRPVSETLSAPDFENLAQQSGHWGETRTQPLRLPDRNDQPLALRLAAALGNTKPAQKIRALVDNGQYSQALEAYKTRLDEILSTEKNHLPAYLIDRSRPESVRKTMEQFTSDSPWHGEAHQCDTPSPLTAAFWYSETKEEVYFTQFLVILESLVTRQKAEYDVLEDRLLNAKQIVPQAWKWFMGFDNSTQALTVLMSLILLHDHGVFDRIPAKLLAQTSLFLLQDSLYTMLKDGRANVPNQKTHVMEILFQLSKNHPDFLWYDMIKTLATEQLQSLFDRIIYPDGTCLEQAFNYNGGVVRNFKDLRRDFPEIPLADSTELLVRNLSRMLEVTRIPASGHPAVGTTGFLTPPDLRDPAVLQEYRETKLYPNHSDEESFFPWPDRDRMLQCMMGDLSDPPKFTSVYFPYNAQAVLRDGFAWDDQYFFFYAPRKGSGHSVENVNEIFFFDYGRPMLINAGACSYGFRNHMDDDQVEIMPQLDHYQHNSYGRNTVLVDGTSQSRLKEGDSCVFEKYPTAAGNKFYHGVNFLYVEGNYQDGYYSSDTVHHQREIFYYKPSGIFFILDNLTDDRPHTYTQNWGFMPQIPLRYSMEQTGANQAWGFADNEIRMDENTSRIFTSQVGAPNIFLYQFSNFPLRYTRNRGELNPAQGWISPEIGGRRLPKTDIHTHWDAPAGTSSVLTVVITAPDEKPGVTVEKYQKDGISGCDITLPDKTKLTFRFAPDSVAIPLEDGNLFARALLLQENTGIVLGGTADYVMQNGIALQEIGAPKNLTWKDEDGYSIPVYEY